MSGGDGPPPVFDGDDFPYWKICMEAYLEAIDIGVYKAAIQGFPEPRDPTNLVGEEFNYEKRNAKAKNILFRGLCKDVFNRFRNHKNVHDLWMDICALHEGTRSEREERYHIGMRKLNSFEMLANENANAMYSRLNILVEEVNGLGLTQISQPKTCFQEALVNNNFVFLRSRGSAVSSNPHNRHIAEISPPHGVNMTLFDAQFSEDGMAWPPGSIFRIFISTLHIITITIMRIFRQALHCLLSNFLCVRLCHRFIKPSNERIRNFLFFIQLLLLSYLLLSLLLLRHGVNVFKPKLEKLENQTRASEQKLKFVKITQTTEMAYQIPPLWVHIYTPSAPQLGGPRLSLTFAILAKGRCFFGPSA
jgi:hypothetical protein